MQALGSCGTWAQPLLGMWDPPEQGLHPDTLHWQADIQPLDPTREAPGVGFEVKPNWVPILVPASHVAHFHPESRQVSRGAPSSGLFVPL